MDSIRRQIRWLSFGAEPNLFVRYHPLRPLVHWYYSRRVNAYVRQELDQRVKDFARDGTTLSHSKTIMDLALGDHLEKKANSKKTETVKVDPFFREV